jgi:hypothetical protein
MLDFSDGFLVEGSDAPGQGVHKLVQFGIRQRTIDVAIALGEFAVDVVALNRISSARPRPTRRGKRAIGPPPGTNPAPISNCESTAFSRLAKRMSHARESSLPTPVARPRIDTIDTTGERLRRTSISGSGGRPVGPFGMPIPSCGGGIGLLRPADARR